MRQPCRRCSRRCRDVPWSRRGRSGPGPGRGRLGHRGRSDRQGRSDRRGHWDRRGRSDRSDRQGHSVHRRAGRRSAEAAACTAPPPDPSPARAAEAAASVRRSESGQPLGPTAWTSAVRTMEAMPRTGSAAGADLSGTGRTAAGGSAEPGQALRQALRQPVLAAVQVAGSAADRAAGWAAGPAVAPTPAPAAGRSAGGLGCAPPAARDPALMWAWACVRVPCPFPLRHARRSLA